MNSLYEAYKDRVEFYLVYIREAHPTDGWQVPANEREGILFTQPKTLEQRVGVLAQMCESLKLNMPAVVDGLDDKVCKAYNAWPDRMYLIDKNGKIAYQGRPGPAGFKPAELERAIKVLLSAEPRTPNPEP